MKASVFVKQHNCNVNLYKRWNFGGADFQNTHT